MSVPAGARQPSPSATSGVDSLATVYSTDSSDIKRTPGRERWSAPSGDCTRPPSATDPLRTVPPAVSRRFGDAHPGIVKAWPSVSSSPARPATSARPCCARSPATTPSTPSSAWRAASTARAPSPARARLSFVAADVAAADLRSLFEGADAVIHLAWALQPAHEGGAAVAHQRARQPAGDRRRGGGGRRTAAGGLVRRHLRARPAGSARGRVVARDRHRDVDVLDAEGRPGVGVRPRRGRWPAGDPAAAGADLSAGVGDVAALPVRGPPCYRRPSPAAGCGRCCRGFDQLRFQAVHADDVAEAYRLALHADTDGAFNIAAEPVVTGLVARTPPGRPARSIRPERSRYLHAAGFGARAGIQRAGLARPGVRVAADPTPGGRSRSSAGHRRAASLDALDELAGGLRDRIVGGTAALSASPA